MIIDQSARKAGDRRLVDGGVVNNTPISHAVELGAERIYVIPTEDPAYRPADHAPRTALYAAICGLWPLRPPVRR